MQTRMIKGGHYLARRDPTAVESLLSSSSDDEVRPAPFHDLGVNADLKVKEEVVEQMAADDEPDRGGDELNTPRSEGAEEVAADGDMQVDHISPITPPLEGDAKRQR